MLSLVAILVLLALIVTIAHAVGRAPLWVAVFLLVVIHALEVFPN